MADKGLSAPLLNPGGGPRVTQPCWVGLRNYLIALEECNGSLFKRCKGRLREKTLPPTPTSRNRQSSRREMGGGDPEGHRELETQRERKLTWDGR